MMSNQHGGELRVNGQPAAKVPYKSSIGFVPQDDIVDPSLTTREVLTYAAQTRLPASWSAAMIRARVDMVLKQLDLWHVQNTRIGDEVTRGLSGGEKKRVSIGIELVANPSAIFLDEPTSGLDASSAEQLSSVLLGVARTGRCVVAVVHQPRLESFLKYDKLLLLGRGGHVVYFGDTKDVGSYFKALDPELACPEGMNIANHILDIVSGVFDNKLHRSSVATLVINDGGGDDVKGAGDEKKTPYVSNPVVEEDYDDAKDKKMQFTKPVFARDLPEKWKQHVKANPRAVSKTQRRESESEREMRPRATSTLRTAYAMFWRSMLLWLRDSASRTLLTILSVAMAILLGVGFSPYIQQGYVYEPPLPEPLNPWCPNLLDCTVPASVEGLEQLLFFLTVALGSVTGMVGARVFSGDILVIKREGNAGVSTLLQGVIKLLVDLIGVILYSSIFAGTWIPLGHPGEAQDWFALCISLGVAASGVGSAVSLAIDRDNSLLVPKRDLN